MLEPAVLEELAQTSYDERLVVAQLGPALQIVARRRQWREVEHRGTPPPHGQPHGGVPARGGSVAFGEVAGEVIGSTNQ